MKRSVAFGVALGLWLLLWLWIYVGLVASMRGLGPWDIPHDFRLSAIETKLGISHTEASLWLGLGPPLAALLWAGLTSFLGIDREQLVRQAFRWTARVLARPASLIVFSLWGILFVAANFWPYTMWLVLPAVIFPLAVPLLVLSRKVAGSDTGGQWWVPSWPGADPLVVVFLLGMGFTIALPALASTWPLWVLFSLSAPSIVGAVLIHQLGPRKFVVSLKSITWRDLSPHLSFWVGITFIATALLAPFWALQFFAWHNLSAFAAAYASSMEHLSSFERGLARASGLAYSDGAKMLPVCIYLLLTFFPLGRLIWLQRRESEEAEQGHQREE